MQIAIPFWLFILFYAPNSDAREPDSFEAHSAIQSTVLQYLESNLRHEYSKLAIDLQAIDQRLRLNRCESPLDTFSPPGQNEIGSVTVGVRCEGPKPWLVYVRARIRASGLVVVARRALSKGSLITAADIKLKEVELTRTHQPFFNDPDAVIGKELRWSVPAESILTANQLSIPKAVKKGEQVIILAINDGLQIRMKGAALSDGVAGQKIAVKNLSSNRIIQGTVKSAGIVQVQF